jgi:hypothetical protein
VQRTLHSFEVDSYLSSVNVCLLKHLQLKLVLMWNG